MTKNLIAIGALASLSIAACDGPRSQPAVVPTVTVASNAAAPAQPSALETPASEPPASSKPPACVPDGSHPLMCAKAPELELERVTGTGPGSLARARGQVVMLSFCATWAEPCKKSLPVYQAIAKEHPGRVALIVVVEDSPDAISGKELREYASSLKVDASILWDKAGKAGSDYGLPNFPFPALMIVDPAGAVRSIHAGYHDSDEEGLRKEIKDLL
jgi:thiol-disulfide isomerase/thioredoxin